MNRRTALKNCFIFTAGAALIPACMQEKSKSSLLLKNLKISGQQEQLMADLSDTIIPTTDTPGAKDVGAHLFALMMIDECYQPEEQKKFMSGLEAFQQLTKKKFDTSFSKLTPQQRSELLTELEAKKDEKDNEAVAFYKVAKGMTLQAFTGSKYYLTKVRVYEMAPGRFHGCVPVKSAKA